MAAIEKFEHPATVSLLFAHFFYFNYQQVILNHSMVLFIFFNYNNRDTELSILLF